MKMDVTHQLLSLFVLFSIIDAYKILTVFPVPSRSHWNLGNSLARGIAEAGHDVTLISPFPDKVPVSNGKYRDVVLTGVTEFKDKDEVDFFEMEKLNPLLSLPILNFVGNDIVNTTLSNENLKKLLSSNETFDLVIVEQLYIDAMKVLAWHYKAPLVVFSTVGANFMVNTLVGNPAPPSYVPDMNLSYGTNMNFCQRFINSLMILLKELNNVLFSIPQQNEVMKRFFPDSPDLETFLRNISLVLLNAHESVSYPMPALPNMINIGGYHIRPPKELPKDLKKIMDNAKEGVIYFSMGSIVPPNKLPKEIKSAIFATFGKLKQTIIVKWSEDVPDLPKNIILRKWCPQQEILAHPNVKLFVTHGGLLSTLETVYHGVPVLALPVFGDQKMNANNALELGYGRFLLLADLTETTFTDNINELLQNPKYTLNVKTRSALMKDRPVKPMDLAVYWCEFVIRHKGAPHLRVAALDLTWYQYFLLDIIFVVLMVIVSFVVGIYFVAKKICNVYFLGKLKKVKKN